MLTYVTLVTAIVSYVNPVILTGTFAYKVHDHNVTSWLLWQYTLPLHCITDIRFINEISAFCLCEKVDQFSNVSICVL